jgi:hypothetical protein
VLCILNFSTICRLTMINPPGICSWHSKDLYVVLYIMLGSHFFIQTIAARNTYLCVFWVSLSNKIHKLFNPSQIYRFELFPKYPTSIHLFIQTQKKSKHPNWDILSWKQ